MSLVNLNLQSPIIDERNFQLTLSTQLTLNFLFGLQFNSNSLRWIDYVITTKFEQAEKYLYTFYYILDLLP